MTALRSGIIAVALLSAAPAHAATWLDRDQWRVDPAPTGELRMQACARPQIAIRVGCLSGLSRPAHWDAAVGRSAAMAMLGGLALAILVLASAPRLSTVFNRKGACAPRSRTE